MKVLVTGAAGFVGSHLINELQGNGHEVVATANNNENLKDGVTSYFANLAEAEEVNNNIDFSGVDAVVHLAGLAAVGPSFDEPLKYISINSALQINLYEACIKQGVTPRFLIISSGSLYDPKVQMPINEASPIVPSSPYAISKISQEYLAKYYGNRGFEYIIARPFNHIGPGQKEGFIVPDFAKQIAAAEQGEITELLVGNLEAKRDYTDVRDIVKAYRLIIEKGKNGEVYNICSGNSFSGKEILDGLLSNSSAKITVKQDPARMRPADILEIIGDHSKITKDTGWNPSIALTQTLSDALEDWR